MGLEPHRVTLIRPASERNGFSASLPPDLLEQVRKRVGLLALLLAAAFVFDPVFSLAGWLLSALGWITPPQQPARELDRRLVELPLRAAENP